MAIKQIVTRGIGVCLVLALGLLGPAIQAGAAPHRDVQDGWVKIIQKTGKANGPYEFRTELGTFVLDTIGRTKAKNSNTFSLRGFSKVTVVQTDPATPLKGIECNRGVDDGTTVNNELGAVTITVIPKEGTICWFTN